MKPARRLLAAVTLLAFTHTGTGCFGSFQLVQKVYGFNKSMGNKFVREIVFLVFVILPVYGLASLADALIFNLIEFWTDKNPLAMAPGETQERVVEQDGKTLKMTFADQGRTLRLEVLEPGQAPAKYTVSVDEEGATIADGAGQLLATSGLDANGGLVVRDAQGDALLSRSAEDLAKLEDAVPAGPAAVLAADAHRADGCAMALAH
ncbi:MAG: DUF3332 domain-containing protein [Deltaproteobacteria bacterium]|nr:DUF3332 domain-containing protein [Deltaproteobacteria bacterium]